MKKLIAFTVGCIFVALTSSSYAQSAYAGSYYTAIGITVGQSAGTFAQGGATIFRSGLVIGTVYYAGVGGSDTFNGVVNRRGVLTLDSPNFFNAVIFKSGKRRFATGNFGSPLAGGNAYLHNYQ
jgi:hypothetical protein